MAQNKTNKKKRTPFHVNFANICTTCISIAFSVTITEYLDGDDSLANYVILSKHAENKIRKKRSLWTNDWALNESSNGIINIFLRELHKMQDRE